jgi:hypothetical protein
MGINICPYCSKKIRNRKICEAHYRKLRRYGDPFYLSKYSYTQEQIEQSWKDAENYKETIIPFEIR